jgi:hypothetical protein
MAGFADGFRSGFGLISDVKDRELQRDRLEEQARQGDLDRKSTSEYREGQLEIGRKRNEIDDKKVGNDKLRLTNENLRLGNQREQLGLDKTRIDADANFRKAQTDTLTDDLDLKKQRRGQRKTNSAAAVQVQSFVDLSEQVRTGEVAYDTDTQARLAEMAESTRGTLMDLNYVTQPNVQFQAGRLKQVLDLVAEGKADQIDETALRDTFNVVFHSNNMAGVGELVTSETHKHAGSFADKGYVVVGKQVSSVGLEGDSLGLKVDVLIEDPDTGNQFTYEAPMTVGREASADKAFMSVEEAVQAASGFYQYAQAMAPYRGILGEINQRGYDLTEGRKDGDFLQLVAEDIKAAEIDGARNPDLSSPIKGMTMSEFAADKGLMRSHYSSNRVGNYQPVEAALAGDATYNLISKAPMLEGLERYNEGKPLSRAKVLEASQYLSPKEDRNGNITFVIDNKEEWNEWRNNTFRTGGYRTPSEELSVTGAFNSID